jgi:hypothetical protein
MMDYVKGLMGQTVHGKVLEILVLIQEKDRVLMAEVMA